MQSTTSCRAEWRFFWRVRPVKLIDGTRTPWFSQVMGRIEDGCWVYREMTSAESVAHQENEAW